MSAEKRNRVTGVWRRVRVCVLPDVVVMHEAGFGSVHCCEDGVVDEDAAEGIDRAFRKTQFLLLVSNLSSILYPNTWGRVSAPSI